MISAGLRRHRVTVQTKTTTADAQGGRTVAFSALLTQWPARVEALRGNELLQSKAIGSETQYRVTLPAPNASAATIAPAMRVVWHTFTHGDKTLEIHGVMPSERGDELVLTCGAVS